MSRPVHPMIRAALFLFPLAATIQVGSAAVDFSRDVLPILSDACFHCHGPDEKTREADLRLDQKDGIFRSLDGITVVKPGAPDESELITRIHSQDRDDVMPPAKATRQLSKGEIEILTQWVKEGASWSGHWAFEPLKPVALPKDDLQGWGNNEIDLFVGQRLASEGLHPAPEASKERLIRRVTLDFTGLPATPAEVDAFLADTSANAYERVVDRLLASPRFGERLATEWLDLARYADSHGYQADNHRDVWAWRDWVIGAFNRDLPFDQFVTWQIAGDLLPNATKEQKIATAFNRLHCQTVEGGVVDEEYRVAYVADRVNTFGTAFLGLTLECSRCHDHKYDPLTQRDFYSLFSLFQNIDESGQIPGFLWDSMPAPKVWLTNDAQDAELAALREKIAAAEAQLTDALRAAEAASSVAKAEGQVTVERPKPLIAFNFDEIKDGAASNSVDASKPAKVVGKPELIAGVSGKAVALDGENGFEIPGVAHFTRADPFSISIWVKPPGAGDAGNGAVVHLSMGEADAAHRGYEILLKDGRVMFGLHHQWPVESLRVITRQPIAQDRWTHIAATYDGSSRAKGCRIYLDGRPVEVETVRDTLQRRITYPHGAPPLRVGFRFRAPGFKGGQVDELSVYSHALTELEAAELAGCELGEHLAAAEREYSIANSDSVRAAAKVLHDLRTQEDNLVNGFPELMVMKELPDPKLAFVLKRGAYDAPGEQVVGGTPAVLPTFPEQAPRNRLGLAQWLLDPEHPLMARVTVNRYWHILFGRGLVETVDNFGVTGAPPTHPELLDWLAKDFIGSGWSIKSLLKKIAMSATYRQATKASPDLLARDPQNELLARGPVQRLSAEMLRDQALAVSGLLDGKIGGPSVKPYQPPGIWDIAMGKPQYQQGKGSDLYRRSLYTFWKRTVPPPSMLTFDAAERSFCSVKRQSTSTPLQALVLLNDVQQVEAARFVGERMLKEGGKNEAEKVAWTFRLITNREPTWKEFDILQRLYREQLEEFRKRPDDAVKLLAYGEKKSDESLGRPELAAATALAQAVLNFDEAIFKR